MVGRIKKRHRHHLGHDAFLSPSYVCSYEQNKIGDKPGTPRNEQPGNAGTRFIMYCTFVKGMNGRTVISNTCSCRMCQTFSRTARIYSAQPLGIVTSFCSFPSLMLDVVTVDVVFPS